MSLDFPKTHVAQTLGLAIFPFISVCHLYMGRHKNMLIKYAVSFVLGALCLQLPNLLLCLVILLCSLIPMFGQNIFNRAYSKAYW